MVRLGVAADPEIAKAKSIEDLNSPDVELAYIIGMPEEIGIDWDPDTKLWGNAEIATRRRFDDTHSL